MKYLDALERYFELFDDWNDVAFYDLVHESLVLVDWANKIYGAKQVAEFTREVSCEIDLTIKKLSVVGNKGYCEIIISKNEAELPVLDVITFKGDKIILIEAYRAF